MAGMEVVSINGRYPGNERLNPDAMYADVEVFGEDIVIRIGDKQRPEVWFDVFVERGKIQTLLEETDHADVQEQAKVLSLWEAGEDRPGED